METSPYKTGFDKAFAKKREMQGYADGSRAAYEARGQTKAAAAKSAGLAQWARRYDALHKSTQPQTSDAKFKAAVAQLQRIRVQMATAPRNPTTQGCRRQQSVLEDLSTGLHHGNRR